MSKRYLLIFPLLRNVHLIKDVGMIPYLLHAKYSFDSVILTFQNGEYPYLQTEVEGLNLEFIKKHNKNLLNVIEVIKYLIKNAKKFDCLQLFHTTKYTLLYLAVYKMLNPKGVSVIWTDLNKDQIESSKTISKIIFKLIIKLADLVSVQTISIYDLLKQHKNVVFLPNGFLFKGNIDLNINSKENIILTVNRFGDADKNCEMLFDIIPLVYNRLKNWNFIFVGEILPKFEEKITAFFNKYPEIKNIVAFKGQITDRKQLYDIYRKSKIFILTSKTESFSLASIEAGAFGNITITTNTAMAKDRTKHSYFSKIIEVNDHTGFANEIIRIAQSNDLNKKMEDMREYIYNDFNWDKIIDNLYNHINLKNKYK